MGNYKFKLSDMMPNAWFYKLRDMRSKPKNTHPVRKKQLPSSYPQFQSRPSLSQPRHATSSYQYHYNTTTTTASSETETAIDKFCTSSSFINSTHFLEPPAAGKTSNSNKINSKRKSIYKPSPKRTDDASVSTQCNCRRAVMLNSPLTLTLRDKSPQPPVRYIKELDSASSSPDAPEFFGSHRCRITASSTDIIIDVKGKSFSRKIDSLGRFQYEPDSVIPEPEPEKELVLPPILTKPIKPKVVIASELEKQGRDDPTRKPKPKTKTKKMKKKKYSDGMAGIKVRGNSPRIASKKSNQMELGGSSRRSVWSSGSGKKKNLSGESFAIVKSSFDPETDFKDSMVEMIIENNIRASKDLEDLLALYLSLNSDEYHDLIIKAFEQIWFDMAHLRL